MTTGAPYDDSPPLGEREEPPMKAIPYDRPPHDDRRPQDHSDVDDPQDTLVSARRPRRRFWGARTGVLVAVLVGAVCFYAGVRVEKGQVSNNSSAVSGAARAFAARAGAGATGGSGTAGRAGAFAGSGNLTFGTVSSLSGKNLYITDTSGNTVKVTVTSSTAVTKSQTVGKKAVRPGDSVVVQGVQNARGALAAASVSDWRARGSGDGGAAGLHGAGSAARRSSSSARSGASGGASSAVNSLFGKGG